MTLLNQTFYMVPDLVKYHKNTTTCLTAIVRNKQSKKCYFKIRSNRHGQTYAIRGQFGSNAVKFYFTPSYYFLLVFFKSLNFRKPPWKPFLGIFPNLKLFPSISNSFQLFSQKSFQMWEFCRFSLWGTHRKGLLLSLRL